MKEMWKNVNLSDRIPITPLVALAYMLFVIDLLPLYCHFRSNQARIRQLEMGHIRSRIHHWIGLALLHLPYSKLGSIII